MPSAAPGSGRGAGVEPGQGGQSVPAFESVDEQIDTALARAVVYRVLALGLGRDHEAALRVLSMPARRDAFELAVRRLDGRRREADPLAPAARALLDLPRLSAADLSSAHARLFGHAHGLVPAFETDYGAASAFRQPQDLADIAGYYLAFGLQPPSGLDERADHAACECEFMEFLALKEAYLLEAARTPDLAHAQGAHDEGVRAADGAEDEEATLAAVREAARSFLRGHLGRFGRAFAARLAREDEGGFHGALGTLLFRFLALEAERLRVPVGPATIELRPPAPEPAPMACGDACGSETETIRIEHRGRP